MRIKGTTLYQPIFNKDIGCEADEEVRRMYDTKYVRGNCISWVEGIGGVFIKSDSEVSRYDSSPSVDWLPKRTYDLGELDLAIRSLTLEWQSYITENLLPSLEFISEEKRKREIKFRNHVIEYNRKLIERLNIEERYLV